MADDCAGRSENLPRPQADESKGRPDPGELVARARAMIPTLAGRSLAARRQRRTPGETIAEMQRAGFFRVLQPRRWGGYELELDTFYEVELALAEGDMSAAWIYGVLGVHPWFMAVLDERAAREVWGEDTSVLICSSLMPAGKAVAVEGGFRLTGRWRYASGCEHCDWALLGALVSDSRLDCAGRRRRAERPAACGAHLPGAGDAISEHRYLARVRPAGDRKLGRRAR